jgi:hypothetical protein
MQIIIRQGRRLPARSRIVLLLEKSKISVLRFSLWDLYWEI